MREIHINNDNNYATPPDLYHVLDKEHKFDFDPCPFNHDLNLWNGLEIEWGMRNFVNPPYTLKLKTAFVKKGIEQMKKGKSSLFLVPVSTSTKLFKELIYPNAKTITFVSARIKFGKLDEDGRFYLPLKNGKVQSGTKDSMLVLFDGEFKNPNLSLMDNGSEYPIYPIFKMLNYKQKY